MSRSIAVKWLPPGTLWGKAAGSAYRWGSWGMVVVVVVVPGEEGTVGDLWNYRSSQESPYIWRDISRSLDLGITQVGAARLWVHDDLSPSPGQEVAYLGPGAPALGSSWSGWTHAPWRPEPQRTCQRWHERQVPHCACATRRVGARTR